VQRVLAGAHWLLQRVVAGVCWMGHAGWYRECSGWCERVCEGERWWLMCTRARGCWLVSGVSESERALAGAHKGERVHIALIRPSACWTYVTT